MRKEVSSPIACPLCGRDQTVAMVGTSLAESLAPMLLCPCCDRYHQSWEAPCPHH